MNVELPPIVRTSDGFDIEGSGPDLLEELLGRYESLLSKHSPRIQQRMLPGLTSSEIRAGFDSLQLVAPEEAIVW